MQEVCPINLLATNVVPLAYIPSLFIILEGPIFESSPPPKAMENEDTLQIMIDDSPHFS